jgi:hypothetical protein
MVKEFKYFCTTLMFNNSISKEKKDRIIMWDFMFSQFSHTCAPDKIYNDSPLVCDSGWFIIPKLCWTLSKSLFCSLIQVTGYQ